ncbi:MAG: 3-oxoacyl-ACP synthase III [Planctomycetota bacterium]
MKYSRVAIAGLGHVLPDEAVTSAEIEARLAPLYDRLRLPEGRLELMSGIRERRFFPAGAKPSDISLPAADAAIEASGIDRRHIGALIHGSVCRDFLEPATACRVHHELGLPAECLAFDLSNACLGVLTGAMQIATMIEARQVRAGVVVGTELGRGLVDNTIERLNADASLTRETVKPWVASLTIGSASAAMVLCDRDLVESGAANAEAFVTAATAHAATAAHRLCQSEGLAEVMQTDSEQLMRKGVAAGAATFERFLGETGWSRDAGAPGAGLRKTVCHQVGSAHRKMMLDRLGVDPAGDYATLEWLGNTGSAALPVSLALAAEVGWVERGDRVGLLGIGSGVNCLMLGLDWRAATAAKPTNHALRGPHAAVSRAALEAESPSEPTRQ